MNNKIKVDIAYLLVCSKNTLFDLTMESFADKEIFFTSGLRGNKYFHYQLIGNLGGHANEGVDFDNDISYFVVSNSIINDLRDGISVPEISNLENRINNHWTIADNLSIITESDLLLYLYSMAKQIQDLVSLELLNRLNFKTDNRIEILSFFDKKVEQKNAGDNFVAIDFETATEERHSICQVGIVKVKNGQIVDTFSSYVKPPFNKYSDRNSLVHGIYSNQTGSSKTFDVLWEQIAHYFSNQLIVAHNTNFDIDALIKSLNYYDLPIPHFKTFCTYKRYGMSLKVLCEAFDIDLSQHHDALADAKACAQVMLKHLKDEMPDISKIKTTPQERGLTALYQHKKIENNLFTPDFENADPNSSFYKKKVVFTGDLMSMKRQDAAAILKKQGADIDSAISRKTDFVIIGQGAGPKKMEQIEDFNKKGSQIRLIFENEFLEMVN